MLCGDLLRYGTFESGSSGCMVSFPEFPDHALLLTAGHVVLPTFAQRGDAISDSSTGDVIGRLFTWTSIDGDPTADAALIWIDPSKVSPMLKGLVAPREINVQPAVGDVVRIAPHGSQQQPREARIASLDDDVSVLVSGPGWPSTPTVTYRSQIRTDRLISEGGDSGAIALDGSGRVIGMVVAGSAESGTIITPISAILRNAAWGGLQLQLVDRLSDSFLPPPEPGAVPDSEPASESSGEATSTPFTAPASPDDFVRRLAPAAVESMHRFGIPASFTVAQAALESGWGRSQLALRALNLFGVKADSSWTGQVLLMNTREFIDNQWVVVNARWRQYPDLQECIDDHARFFQDNPRYANCFKATTGEEFAVAVAKAGYATDPKYADKLLATMRKHGMQELDLR